jgi:ribonucleoside-diphosphate reductase beta chain
LKTRIQTPKSEFTVDYPEACAFTDQQAAVFWPHFEVKVAKDKQDILVNMTEAERHGTITTLKLFTKYEQIIGDEFWLGFVYKKFPRPADIQPMAALFGAMETAVHGKFYSTLNEELGIATDEFYNEYLKDEDLRARVEFLEETLATKDDLRALGCFTFGEGAILYSSFAFLKHFQSQGKNKLLNVVSGINFSARDEALHSEAAAWLFKTLLKEMKESSLIDEHFEQELHQDIIQAAETVLLHEKAIIKKIFEKGKIDGITDVQLEHFAQSRINLCLRNMGYDNLYKVEYNPVAEWFYKGINGYSMIDFFNSQGNQYQRDWDSQGFKF